MRDDNDRSADRNWTVMIYMSGDNNLSVDMAYALQDIRETVKDRTDINVLVYYDCSIREVPTSYFDFSDYKRPFHQIASEVKGRVYPYKMDASYSANENSAKARSVLNFVDWCVNKVPHKEGRQKKYGRRAKNYALIFSGHSFGFQNIGFFRDENSNYHMTLSKLRWVLEVITATQDQLSLMDTKIEDKILGQKLAILGFDSCVMSMLEVGYEFSKYADTLIASEGSIPEAGWTYGKLLDCITECCRPEDIIGISKNLVREFIQDQNAFAIGGVAVDLAAWNLRKVRPVAVALGELATALHKCFEDPASTLYRQMKRVLLQAQWMCQSYMFEQNVDLSDFCRLLYEELDHLKTEIDDKETIEKTGIVRACCAEVISKINDCVILSGFSGGTYQYSNGMSLFFPWTSGAYKVSQRSYEALQFIRSKNTGAKWKSFLHEYLGKVTLRRGRDLEERIIQDRFIGPDKKHVQVPMERVFYTKIGLSENGRLGLPENGRLGLPENGRLGLPENGRIGVPENGRIGVPENGRLGLPENGRIGFPQPSGRGMFLGALSSFAVAFKGIKNVESPLNVAGFTGSETDQEDQCTEEVEVTESQQLREVQKNSASGQ